MHDGSPLKSSSWKLGAGGSEVQVIFNYIASLKEALGVYYVSLSTILKQRTGFLQEAAVHLRSTDNPPPGGAR